MSESGMRSTLVKALQPLDAVAIESPTTGIGIPDVNYRGGWIECKWMKFWPKSADTSPVRFDHPLSKEQGNWLYRRTKRGGTAFCCCKVSRSWFFFDGATIRERFNAMTRPEMIEEAVFYCPNGLEKERLLAWLSQTSTG